MDEKIFGELDKKLGLKASGLNKIHTIERSKYKTIPEVFIHSCRTNEDNDAIGYREILKQKETDGCPKYKMGKYNWITYKELFNLSKNFGCGVRNICKLKQKSKIVIYISTKKDSFIASNGLHMQNYTIVLPYENIGIEGLIHALNQTKSKVIIINEKHISKLKGRCKYLKYAIIIPDDNNNEHLFINQNSIGLKCYMFDEIIQHGECSNILSLPSQTNKAFIVYNNKNKGVSITHQNLIVSIYGIQERVMATHKDVYMGYIPLTHLFGLLMEYVCIFNGSKIGYGTPQTLTDKSDYIMKHTKGDATKLNPTIIPFLSTTLNKLKESITNKIDESPSNVQKLYHNIYDKKKEYLDKHKSLQNYNGGNGIFNVIKKCLGSNLKTIILNNGTLSSETRDFFHICFDINILHGYSSIETCGFSCISTIDHYNHTTVGSPLIHNYIKLIKGQICIGGHNITSGYYKNDEETLKKYFIMNNLLWFKTGDIGKIYSNGTLDIIGKKKIQTNKFNKL
jgi:long-chain acyl-CoA synthetase